MTTNGTATPPRNPQEFGWLLNNLVASQPSVDHALIVSSDGLPLTCSQQLGDELAEPLSAMISGLLSLGHNIAQHIDGGGCRHLHLRLDHGHFLFMGIGELAGVAVLARENANLGVIAHQMTQLVEAVGHVLTPQMRDDLRRHLVDGQGAP